VTWVVDAADWTPRRLKWKVSPTCACHRGAGDWDWLEAQQAPLGDRPRLEASWFEISPADRQVVVDVREPSEIREGEWEWFQAAGCEVVHFPWTRWGQTSPSWDPNRGYAILCARGIRSLAAVKTVPPGIRAVSITGGMFALAQPS